jgi:hypothetical protein
MEEQAQPAGNAKMARSSTWTPQSCSPHSPLVGLCPTDLSASDWRPEANLLMTNVYVPIAVVVFTVVILVAVTVSVLALAVS